MTISMYDVTVPAFVRAFSNLSALLAKAEAHAQAQGLDPNTFLDARLAPDMGSLIFQIQRASDTAKGCVVRLGAAENASFPDTETSFSDLVARISATLALLGKVDRGALDGAETRQVELKLRDRTVTFAGLAYVTEFVLPNFYFHVATAYDLLRHKGLQIGKSDYLGPLG